MKNQPALKAEVDKLVDQAQKEGTLNSFSQKWMQAPLPANFGA
jgi:polar amino acid transport system substrate-binding protein